MPNQGKLLKTNVSSEKNVTYLELRAYLGQKQAVAQNNDKINFLLQHLFIAILCVKISCVTWA